MEHQCQILFFTNSNNKYDLKVVNYNYIIVIPFKHTWSPGNAYQQLYDWLVVMILKLLYNATHTIYCAMFKIQSAFRFPSMFEWKSHYIP